MSEPGSAERFNSAHAARLPTMVDEMRQTSDPPVRAHLGASVEHVTRLLRERARGR